MSDQLQPSSFDLELFLQKIGQKVRSGKRQFFCQKLIILTSLSYYHHQSSTKIPPKLFTFSPRPTSAIKQGDQLMHPIFQINSYL